MKGIKYIAELPTEEADPVTFAIINYNLIANKVKKSSNGLTFAQVRQLLSLQMVSQQKRKVYIGLFEWLKQSPSNGLPYQQRKSNFLDNIKVLESHNYIEVLEVLNGNVIRLTPEGELLSNNVTSSFHAYYTRIFKQFNMVPKLPVIAP